MKLSHRISHLVLVCTVLSEENSQKINIENKISGIEF